MNKLAVRCTTLIAACAVLGRGLINPSPVMAVQIYQSPVEWSIDVRNTAIMRGIINQADPLTPTFVELFKSPIPNARSITFPSGIVSRGQGEGFANNSVSNGTYRGTVKAVSKNPFSPASLFDEIFFDSIIWSFPIPVFAFGGYFDNGGNNLGIVPIESPNSGLGGGLTVTRSFPPGTFVGFIAAPGKQIPSVRFLSTLQFDSTIVNFQVDDVTAYAVPEPTTMAGIVLAGSGWTLLRRKRKQQDNA
ncbi:MAG: hypothetical protein DCF22_25565 [Leptolyngbya sp.]|nr:MAG: hypothetical protein DCF22_25565 [Leptolyngbya sp.]